MRRGGGSGRGGGGTVSEEGPVTAARLRGEGLRIGGLRVFPPLVMAPMAGLTHVAFRRLLAELGGVGLFYSEMLSARALAHEKPGTSPFLSEGGGDRPLCLQIFASAPHQIGPAVERGERWGPEAWDLNLGCPAPVILRQGAGSALAGDVGRAREVAAEMRRRVQRPLLFKIRAGAEEESFLPLAAMLAEEGADAVVVHGRAPMEKLGRPARWDRIGMAASRLPVPVIGNGDVRTPEDAGRMMYATGCGGVMIGRAAVEKPWIFRSASRLFGFSPPPSKYRRKSEVFLRLAVLLGEEIEPPGDIRRLREFARFFACNFKFGHQLWKEVHNSDTMETAVERAGAFFGRHWTEDMIDE